MTTMETSTRIRAYSTIPWPFWLRPHSQLPHHVSHVIPLLFFGGIPTESSTRIRTPRSRRLVACSKEDPGRGLSGRRFYVP